MRKIEVNRWSCPEGKARGALTQRMIHQHQTGHGFHHGDGPGKDAWIVATTPFQRDGVSLSIHGRSGLQKGCHGFKPNAHHDVLSIADAALDASATVGGRADSVPAIHKRVVVVRTPHEGAAQA
jgi:hypothetical protein